MPINLVTFQPLYYPDPRRFGNGQEFRIANTLCDLAGQESHGGDYWDIVQAAGSYIYYCENILQHNYVSYIPGQEPKNLVKNAVTKEMTTISQALQDMVIYENDTTEHDPYLSFLFMRAALYIKELEPLVGE